METLVGTLTILVYLVVFIGAAMLMVDAGGRLRRRFKAARLAWAGFKLLVGIILLPVLPLLFIASKRAFMAVMVALWPHLDVLDEQKKLYLRRFFMTPKTNWFRPRFLHFIAQDDKGRDPHDHPGPFKTRILDGGYDEHVFFPLNTGFRRQYGSYRLVIARTGDVRDNPTDHTHMLKLHGPTWTWVVGWNRGKKWGFWKLDPNDATNDVWVESEQYGVKGEEIKSWAS